MAFFKIEGMVINMIEYNLSDLRNYQLELDQRIHTNHNTCSELTIERRILAFLVELGELANETRCFKYWSYKGASSRQVILEEYVDGIHFLISLANDINLDLTFVVADEIVDLTNLFIKIFKQASSLEINLDAKYLHSLFTEYVYLGHCLGFTNDDIKEGYLAKNKTNHERQEQDY